MVSGTAVGFRLARDAEEKADSSKKVPRNDKNAEGFPDYRIPAIWAIPAIQQKASRRFHREAG